MSRAAGGLFVMLFQYQEPVGSRLKKHGRVGWVLAGLKWSWRDGLADVARLPAVHTTRQQTHSNTLLVVILLVVILLVAI